MKELPDDEVPLFGKWRYWYLLLIVVLVLLMIFFNMLTKYFS